MKNICIIQPILTSYRIPVFVEMARHCCVTVIYSPADVSQGFGSLPQLSDIDDVKWFEVPTIRFFGKKVGMYQRGIIDSFRKNKPDAVILFSNLRYLSFWSTLCWCHFHNIPVFLHGHGLYKKSRVGTLWKLIYRFILWLSSRYICYTSSVADSLLTLGLSENKITIAENSLVNLSPVLPNEKTGFEMGILFIGRLRSGCGLEHLITAADRLRREGYPNIELHIIGEGSEFNKVCELHETRPWIHFYGECYDPKKISDISRKCRVGCYPGNAGLSVVHMFSLSLPPITHNNMMFHGPEPSYIKPEENGFLFEYSNPEEGIFKALHAIFDNPQKLKIMQSRAFNTYETLIQPSLAMRLIKIVNGYQIKNQS